MVPWPISAWHSFRVIADTWRAASRSTTRKPSYAASRHTPRRGYPRPATRNIPGYFFLPFSAGRRPCCGRHPAASSFLPFLTTSGSGSRSGLRRSSFFTDTDDMRDHGVRRSHHANAGFHGQFGNADRRCQSAVPSRRHRTGRGYRPECTRYRSTRVTTSGAARCFTPFASPRHMHGNRDAQLAGQIDAFQVDVHPSPNSPMNSS